MKQPAATVDPHYLHLEELRRISNDIRSRQLAGSKKSTGVAENLPPHKSRYAFARQAREYTDGLDQNDSRKMYSDILATLPDYVDAVHVLPDRHDKSFDRPWLSEADWNAAKEHTIAYNDVFRDIIENNPGLQPDAIMSIVSAAADTYDYSDDDREMIRHNTLGILRGMQHEIAFESVLRELPNGFEVMTTDDNDDAHGADFKVRCPNGVVVSIDVKATQRLEEEAEKRTVVYMARHHKKAPANEIVLFSGFDEYDFDHDNPWRPSQEAVKRVLPSVKSALLKAAARTAAGRTASRIR